MKRKAGIASIILASAIAGGAAAVALFAPVASVATTPNLNPVVSAPVRVAAKVAARKVVAHHDITTSTTKFAPPAGDDHLAIAAGVIGISKDALVAQLKQGKTIAQVASAHGVSTQSVVDALVKHESAELDQEVAAGKLTSSMASAIKAKLQERFTAFVNHTGFCDHSGTYSGTRFRSGDRQWSGDYHYYHR